MKRFRCSLRSTVSVVHVSRMAYISSMGRNVIVRVLRNHFMVLQGTSDNKTFSFKGGKVPWFVWYCHDMRLFKLKGTDPDYECVSYLKVQKDWFLHGMNKKLESLPNPQLSWLFKMRSMLKFNRAKLVLRFEQNCVKQSCLLRQNRYLGIIVMNKPSRYMLGKGGLCNVVNDTSGHVSSTLQRNSSVYWRLNLKSKRG